MTFEILRFANQMTATELHFRPVVLYKVVLTFESVDEIRMCDHSKVLSSTPYTSLGTLYYGRNFS